MLNHDCEKSAKTFSSNNGSSELITHNAALNNNNIKINDSNTQSNKENNINK